MTSLAINAQANPASQSQSADSLLRVAELIEGTILSVLTPLANSLGERVVVQPLTLTLTAWAARRERRWQVAWEMVSDAGRTIRLSLHTIAVTSPVGPSAITVTINSDALFCAGEREWIDRRDAISAKIAVEIARRVQLPIHGVQSSNVA